MAYTWTTFKDAVLGFLPVDKDRTNCTDFIARHIRQAVLDIQLGVKRYQRGHETLYGPMDFTLNNKASLGRLPEGARFKSGDVIRSKAGDLVEKLGDNLVQGWVHAGTTTVVPVEYGNTYRYTKGIETNLVNGASTYTTSQDFVAVGTTVTMNHVANGQNVTAKIQRVWKESACACGAHPVLEWAWDRRQEMIDGQVDLFDNNGRIAVDQEQETFYVYPAILALETINGVDYSYGFRLRWDGRRVDFGDNDPVPFDEPMALTVSYWVAKELARLVDKDVAASDSYHADYRRSMQVLYLDRK